MVGVTIEHIFGTCMRGWGWSSCWSRPLVLVDVCGLVMVYVVMWHLGLVVLLGGFGVGIAHAATTFCSSMLEWMALFLVPIVVHRSVVREILSGMCTSGSIMVLTCMPGAVIGTITMAGTTRVAVMR